ncbi:MAG: DUF2971 domain-containing protein [Alphaproteobacteria bacterium]
MATPNTGMLPLRRYTNLPSLLDILYHRRLTLLSPATWDDKNDAYFMGQYKLRAKLKSVLALCFTEARETYHHWRVFTDGSNGVCIQFEYEKLVECIGATSNVKSGTVRYELIRNIKALRPRVSELPFLKRQPYEDEKEFRIIYRDKNEELESTSLALDLKSIDRIFLSPWMPKALVETTKSIIHMIPGCSKLRVNKTTLLENEQWKRAAERSEAE